MLAIQITKLREGLTWQKKSALVGGAEFLGRRRTSLSRSAIELRWEA
ncbi:MAG TPA: hypothetical protein VKV74_16330 [Bryobacteraceae bacterium]|nr:hypothetical protein [Bryobacteraceae bacterium]